MKMRKLVPYGVLVLLAGCAPVFSVHPLYTRESITFEERLLGTWLVDANKPEETCEFVRLEAGAAGHLPVELQDQAALCYRVNLTSRDGKGSVFACLVKLHDRLFLDVMPSELPLGERDSGSKEAQLNATFFLRLHTFVRVNLSGDQLKLGLTDHDRLQELIQAEPKAVPYTMVKEKPLLTLAKDHTAEEHPLLTASTPELQAFVTKYADDRRLFTEREPLARKASSTAK